MSDSLWSEDDVQRITVSGLAPRRSWLGRQLDRLSPRKRKIAREWKSEWAQRDVEAALANMPAPNVTVSGDSTGGSFTITFNGEMGEQTTEPISSESSPFDVELALMRLTPGAVEERYGEPLVWEGDSKLTKVNSKLALAGIDPLESLTDYQDDNGVWHIGDPPDGDLLSRLTAANDEMIFQGLQDMPSVRGFITRGVPDIDLDSPESVERSRLLKDIIGPGGVARLHTADEDPMSYGDSITAESDQILSIAQHASPWHGDSLKLLHNGGWRRSGSSANSNADHMGVPELIVKKDDSWDLERLEAYGAILVALQEPRTISPMWRAYADEPVLARFELTLPRLRKNYMNVSPQVAIDAMNEGAT